MSVLAKLAGFAIVLAALFGGGAAAGGLLDPDPPGGRVEERPAGDPHGGAAGGDHAAPVKAVRGLAVADDGVRLVVDRPELRRGATERLRFRIVDAAGRAVRDFDVEHAKRMHLIVARRDLSTFQHLHPELRPDGTWTTPLRLAEPGSYRLFADFSHGGRATTLASDLRVDGPADLEPLPAASPASVSDGGYDVRLDGGAPRAGRGSELRFAITQDGEPVHVEPYLGADGHLVALREGDLAFLHVHPVGAGHDDAPAADRHDDSIGFEATFPTPGRYRLFLQFRHEGSVHTVAFTQEVRQPWRRP